MALAGVLLPLLFAAPAMADHESITVDGNLEDLIEAIGRNPGGANGGFAQADLFGEIYTDDCAFVNGFDVENYYFFLDFKNPDGTVSSDATLYGGWEVFGIIGDVDGNESGPPAPRSCAPFGDAPGIGELESYTVEFDLNCDGLSDLTLGVKNNTVGLILPEARDLSGQGSFGIRDSTLELQVNGIKSLFDELMAAGKLPANSDLCNAVVTMTANAELDGPGEDRNVPPFRLEIPPSVSVVKTPDKVEACPDATVNWTIVVTNTGLCTLDEVTVNDILDAGMTYVSSNPLRDSGDAQNSTWGFTSLEPGSTITITLGAQIGATCTGQLSNVVNVDGVHNPPETCGVLPQGAFASDDAFVNCSIPVCSITPDPSGPACVGAAVGLCGPDGNYSYLWTLPDGSTQTTQCISIASATATDAGIYSLVITDLATDCSSDPCTYELIVNDPPVCSITITGGEDASLCVGESLEMCGPDGDYSYAWTLPGGATSTDRCVSITSATAADAGTYSLIVTDNATGCSSVACTQDITVNDPPPCTISGVPTDPVLIGGSFEICGPVGNFTYLWTLPDGSTSTNSCITVTSATSADFGTYELVVTDATTGCSSLPCSAEIVGCTPPTCSITADPSGPVCLGEAVSLCGPAGDYTYLWTHPDGSTSSDQCVTIAAAAANDAGTYTLKITDNATGCESDPCSYELIVNDPPVCSITGAPTDPIVVGTAVEICGPTGNYTYKWTLPDGSMETGQCVSIASFQASDAGDYTLIVTDAATGCSSAPCSVTLTVCDPPDCTIEGPSAICDGEDLTLCGPAGTGLTYKWTKPDGSMVETTDRCVTFTAPVDPGIYTLVVTDGDGCQSTCTHELTVNKKPPCAIAGPGTVCAGQTVELCGPVGDYSHAWTLPDGSTADTQCITLTDPQAGTYKLVVTDNVTGCVSDECTFDLTVTDPPLCSISAEPSGPLCIGASVDLCGPTGDYSYEWTKPNGSVVNTRCIEIASVTSADAGIYSLVVTDNATGCKSAPCTYELIVNDPPPCTITATPPSDDPSGTISRICLGSDLELCGPEGGDYNYAWTLPGGATSTDRCIDIRNAQAGDAGTYSLVVTDKATGCSSEPCTYEVIISDPPPCHITPDPTGPITVGSPVTMCGPDGNYTYKWTLPGGSMSTDRCITIAAVAKSDAGVYTLVVTNKDGCSSTPCSYELVVEQIPCDLKLVKTADPEVIVPQPGKDCHEIGKPNKLTFRYTGQGCSATSHSQDPSKVDCFEFGALSGPVTIVYTGKDPEDFSVSPSGPINVGDIVTITSVGRDRFHSETEIEIRGGSGAKLQELRFHTSCSQPLVIGDQFGALKLLGINEVVGGTDEVTYTYTVTNNGGSIVNASLVDDKLGTIASGFDLGSGETVTYTATAQISVTTTNIAVVSGNLGDENGPVCSAEAEATVTVPVCDLVLEKAPDRDEVTPPGGQDCETIGKPHTLTFRYGGESCSATRHSQDESKVDCFDFGALTGPVTVVYTGKDPEDFSVSPSGPINAGDEVTITSVGRDRFHSETEIEIRDGNGNKLQELRFHTSCSQPLVLGDQFGSLELLGINGVRGEPVDNVVTYTYRVTNNGSPLVDMTLTDDKLGVIATGFDLRTGETTMFTATTEINQTTTNIATVTGHLIDRDGDLCSASASATVRAEPIGTCEEGKPRSLVFEYTGQNCGASSNSQGSKAKCDDVGVLGEPVEIVYVGKDKNKFTVSPAGEVINIGDTFTISASGRDKFHSATKFEIRQGGKVLQEIELHTSCSQPLNIGDQYGSLILREFHINLITVATPYGSGVEVEFGDMAMVSFDQVMEAGRTSLGFVNAPELPFGLNAVNGDAFKFTTTANFAGNITVAVHYYDHLLTIPESELKLLCLVNGGWQEVTTMVDAIGNMVYGNGNPLTTFIVAAPQTSLSADDPVENNLSFGIRSSYPNPTEGRTTVRYTLSKPGAVRLTVHDVQGRQVATLESGHLGAGEHTAVWNGRAIDGRKLAAGIYVVRLEAAEGLRTAKLVKVN